MSEQQTKAQLAAQSEEIRRKLAERDRQEQEAERKARGARDFALWQLGNRLDRIAFDRLEELYPDLAADLENAITMGIEPAEVRRYAIRAGMPKTWVAWLENAARAVAVDVGG